MLRNVSVGVILCVLLVWLYQGVEAIWAYSTGSLSVPGSYVVVSPAASPGATRPFVYCYAPNTPISAGKKGTVTVTCYNGTNHTISATLSYTLLPSSCTTCPNLTGNGLLSYTITANSSSSQTISVNSSKFTTLGTYTIAYSFSTPNSPPVDVSFGFTSTFQLN